MKKYFFSFFLFTNVLAFSQADFRKGYIITTSNDTINGEINYQGDLLNSNKCLFRKSKGDLITEYSPYDILGYRFIESGKFYISKNISSEKGQRTIFLEYLIKAKVNVYYYRDEDGIKDHYLINKDTSKIIELPPLENLVNANGGQYLEENSRSIYILKYFLSDCPDIYSKIEQIRIDHKPLIDLAKTYHQKICKTEQCIVYQKKLPPITIHIEPFAGVTHYIGVNNFISEFGGLLYIWLPRINEKIYFKTGLIYNQLSYESTFYHIYKIPFQLEYLYPKGIIKPKFDTGLNIWLVNTQGQSQSNYIYNIALGFGLMYKITDRIYISTTLNSEFSSIFDAIIQEKNFSLLTYSINVGIKLKF